MTQEQISQILRLLEQIANRPFTITQATDWPMVVVFFGIFGIAIGLFWRDVGMRIDAVKEKINEFKNDDCRAHDLIKAEFEKADGIIWAAMRDCQADCCPRGVDGRKG